MMVTLTKLFVIKMVANVRSESSRNCLICWSSSVFSSSSSLKSAGDSEKKAISEPEAKPDANNSPQASKPAMIAPVDGVIRVTSFSISRK